MTGIYPRVPRPNSETSSRIIWFGEESERRMCEYCQNSKLNRNGRFYQCPTCNQRFPVSDQQEELRVDFNVSKLDIKPALVFQDKMNEDDLRGTMRDELKKKYKITDDEFNDSDVVRPGVRLVGEYDY